VSVFSDYGEARREAQRQANVYGRTMGLERADEYGRTVYRVQIIPKIGQRFGWELRCETVDPDGER
jgi:hypothetical protein